MLNQEMLNQERITKGLINLQQYIANWENTGKTYKPGPLPPEVNAFERPGAQE